MQSKPNTCKKRGVVAAAFTALPEASRAGHIHRAFFMKNSQETEKEIQKVINDTINLIDEYDQKLIELNKKATKEAKRDYLLGLIIFIAVIAAIFITLKFY